MKKTEAELALLVRKHCKRQRSGWWSPKGRLRFFGWWVAARCCCKFLIINRLGSRSLLGRKTGWRGVKKNRIAVVQNGATMSWKTHKDPLAGGIL